VEVDVTLATRCLTLCLLLGWTCPAAAQSLADLARQARERRQMVDPGKQYTNDDLEPLPAASVPRTAAPDASSPSPSDTTDAAPKVSSPAPADSDTVLARPRDKRDEAYWRNRARTLHAAMQKLRDDIGMLEGRLSDLALTDNSPSAARERSVTETNLARLRRDLQFLSLEATAFGKEAREQKVPADWLN
jgi:hypothetical protein